MIVILSAGIKRVFAGFVDIHKPHGVEAGTVARHTAQILRTKIAGSILGMKIPQSLIPARKTQITTEVSKHPW